MNLKEFEEKIEAVAAVLSRPYRGSRFCYRGVCSSLDNIFTLSTIKYSNNEYLVDGLARIYFQKLFCENKGLTEGYFFSSRSKENIPIRLTALYLFKEHCISFELYKEF